MAIPFTDAAQDAVGRTIEEYPDVILKWKKSDPFTFKNIRVEYIHNLK